MIKSGDSRKLTGQIGELYAAQVLEERGYAIVERNWRCRRGELDIVAEHNGRLVFVEVRSRKSIGRFGLAAESVERRKQSQVRLIAQMYMTMHKLHHRPVRFDVITVMLNRDNSPVRFDHYENAF